jgi:murein DD-endopeptidase MepM/ murein hydrolase activator NlpD
LTPPARPSLPAAAFQRCPAIAPSLGVATAQRPAFGPSSHSSRAALLALKGAALLAAAAFASPAAAQSPSPTGGAAPTTPTTPTAPAVTAPTVAASSAAARPVIDAITCRTTCLGIARAAPGSVVRVSGEGMAGVTSVILLGRKGNRDDVTVPATPVSPTAVDAVLPPRAHSGPARAVSAAGQRSLRSSARLVVLRKGAADPGGPIVEAKAQTHRLLFANGRRATVSFYVRGASPVDVAVDVVRASDQAPVAHVVVPAAAPGNVQSVDWDGTIAGIAQPEGRYVFQVSASMAGGAARAAQASAPTPRRESFWLVRNVFPIAGPHTYGDPFGVQRAGHVHQGQDVMAACGTPLVAVHSGKVKFVGTQALAGNYIVISSDDDTADYTYMHLRDRALVAKGATVATGQPIGYVGRTGDATACHLHFELWPAPGWYTGGEAVDPGPTLKAWDTSG